MTDQANLAVDAGAAASWLQQAVTAGEGGKVLLVGFRDGMPQAAWAAGLRGPQDHGDFVVFARFALQGLLDCNGYWLMLPEQVDGARGYRCRLKHRGSGVGLEAWQDAQGWSVRTLEEPALLQDLLVPGASLPGIMRRDLTALADRIEIDPPAI